MVLDIGFNISNAICLNLIRLKAFLVLFLLPVILNAQNTEIDSLKNAILVFPSNSAKVDALNNLSKSYMSLSLDEAIKYGVQARDLADSLKYKPGLALALKNIGLGYFRQADYLNVFEYYDKSLAIYREIGDLSGVALLENNLGHIYFNQGDDATAIEHALRSLSASESLNDSIGMARALILVGVVYMNKSVTLDRAKEYFLRSLEISVNLDYNPGIGYNSVNLGDIYYQQKQYVSALHYLQKALDNSEGPTLISHTLTLMGQVYRDMGEYVKALEYLEKAVGLAEEQNMKDELSQALINLAKTHQSQGNFDESTIYYQKARDIAEGIGASNELKDAYDGLAKLSAEIGDYSQAYRYFQLYDAMRDTLYNLETDEKIKGLQFTYQIEKKQNEIDLLTKDKLLQEANMKRQRFAKNAYLSGFILIIFIALILYRNYKQKAKTNKLLDKQNQEIESLLLNILPEETAKELQQDGYATPRSYDSVSVLFTDFKSFTKIAEGLKPHELIAELNSFFNSFDDIIEKYKLEKIKTIGDAYMCAGGIPVANNTHPERIVKAGLEMQDIMKNKNELRIQQGKQPWELRIGIHTGPVVAGVVGRKKYAYDIWGDTVNIASRMESNGEVGRVNISAVTYDLVKDKFECSYRGKIEAKNKGNIDMYFLDKELVAV